MRLPNFGLPEDFYAWPIRRLESIARVQTGVAKGKKTGRHTVTVPYLRVANVQDGFLDLSEVKCITINDVELERYKLEPSDVLFTEGGDFDKLGRGTVWQGQIAPCVHQNHVFAVRVNSTQLLPQFLTYLSSSPYGRRYFLLCSKQSTNLASINATQLKALPVLLPPLTEQRRIVDILQTWDNAIEKLEAILLAKGEQLVGLRQLTLGYDAKSSAGWPLVPLSKIVKRIRRKSVGGDYPIMTISGRSGFLRQDEKYNRFMAGRSLENYTLLKRGEFAYNKGNSNTYPQGCIYRLDLDSALVPNVYVSFRLSRSLNSDFFVHVFEAGLLNQQLTRLINSGIRNDGLLNINAGEFLSCKVPVPPVGEQRRIAQTLNLAKGEIAAIAKENEAVKRQKRGLMQKLLMGEWRVPNAIGDSARVSSNG